jgi:hypothetical protein
VLHKRGLSVASSFLPSWSSSSSANTTPCQNSYCRPCNLIRHSSSSLPQLPMPRQVPLRNCPTSIFLVYALGLVFCSAANYNEGHHRQFSTCHSNSESVFELPSRGSLVYSLSSRYLPRLVLRLVLRLRPRLRPRRCFNAASMYYHSRLRLFPFSYVYARQRNLSFVCRPFVLPTHPPPSPVGGGGGVFLRRGDRAWWGGV